MCGMERKNAAAGFSTQIQKEQSKAHNVGNAATGEKKTASTPTNSIACYFSNKLLSFHCNDK